MKTLNMKTIATLTTALSLSLTAAGHATAESHHGQAGGPSANDAGPPAGRAEMMQDMMRMMMPMMMQMHSRMMDGAAMGAGPGAGMTMGAGPGAGMTMMDANMMRMMMGSDMMGAGMGQGPAPEAIRSELLARLAEFDADGDGSLSLAEFETLHAAMIRETTVDRFQHLDADGDGRITEAEMGAPARRMEMRGGMPGASGMMDGQVPSGN